MLGKKRRQRRKLNFNERSEEVKDVEFEPPFGSLACKAITFYACYGSQELQAYVIENKPYLTFEGKGEYKHTILLWDASSRCVSGALAGHDSFIRSYTVYEKEHEIILASESADMTIKLWNLSSQTLIHSLLGHENEVGFLTSYMGNGKTILISGDKRNGSVYLWDTDEFTFICTLMNQEFISTLHTFVLHETPFLEIGGSGYTVEIWNLVEKSLVRTIRKEQGMISLVSTRYNSKMMLASGNADGQVRIWYLDQEKHIKTWKAHNSYINSLKCFRWNGKAHSATSSRYDEFVKIWSLDDYKLQTVLPSKSQAKSLAILQIGGQSALATIGSGGKIQLWMESE